MHQASYDGTPTQQIIAGMILDTNALAKIAMHWNPPGLFHNTQADLIGTWCVKHFKKYQTAPDIAIDALFEEWADRNEHDPSTISLVDRMLASIGADYQPLTTDHLIDVAENHFNQQLMRVTADLAQSQIENNQDATEIFSKWKPITLRTEDAINIPDLSEMCEALIKKREPPIITYPDGLGRFFGTTLCRGEFVSLVGGPGSGKSFWLLDFAWRAIQQQRKVAFFEAGDLTKEDTLLRFNQRLTNKPKSNRTVKRPISIDVVDGKTEVIHKDIEMEKMTSRDIKEKFRKFKRRHKKPRMKLSVHSNGSLGIGEILATLGGWKQDQGWVPDVVVVDYADLLAIPPMYRSNPRDGINSNWASLRGVSQDFDCLLVTATQVAATGYKGGRGGVLRLDDFSDDRRKNDHVTGMIGINVDQDYEKNLDLGRLNHIKRRSDASSVTRVCRYAGCLDLGKPHVLSIF